MEFLSTCSALRTKFIDFFLSRRPLRRMVCCVQAIIWLSSMSIVWSSEWHAILVFTAVRRKAGMSILPRTKEWASYSSRYALYNPSRTLLSIRSESIDARRSYKSRIDWLSYSPSSSLNDCKSYAYSSIPKRF